MRSSFLFHGLPAISYQENYIIFSPYARKIARIEKEKINSKKFYTELKKANFFGKPSEFGPGQKQDSVMVILVVTNDCNLRCKYCYVKGGEHNEYMDFELAKTAIKKVLKESKRKKLVVSFFGGEPTLAFPLIKQIVEYVKKNRNNLGIIEYGFSITTNGVIPEKTLNYLLKNNFVFTVSIDGIPSVQDRQRPLPDGSGSSFFIEQTVRKIVKSRNFLNARITVTKNSVKKLEENVRYLIKLGFKFIQIDPISMGGRAKEQRELFRPEAREYVKNFIKVLDMAKKAGVTISSQSYMNLFTPAKRFCDGMTGRNRIIVAYDGTQRLCLCLSDELCTSTPTSGLIVGRYNKSTGKFETNIKKFRRHTNSIPIDRSKKCQECFARYTCGGGCGIQNFHTTGNWNKTSDFHCYVTRSLLKEIIKRIAEKSFDIKNPRKLRG